METTGQRIKRLRNSKKPRMSQKALGDICGVSDVTVGYWEKDLNTPKSDALIKMSDFFGVSEGYILYGEETGNTVPVSSTLKRIPLLSWVQAGMFTESPAKIKTDIEEWIETATKTSSTSFALKVRGDSMFNPNGMPSIPEGAIIIVDPEVQPEHGKIVVAMLEGTNEATVKKLVIDGPYKYLVPLNPTWKKIEINGNCTIIGVVRGVQYEL